MQQMRQLIELTKFSWLILRLKRFSLYCSVFVLFASIFSCGTPKKNSLIDKEDHEVVEDFFRYMAISELGIYTILGSKPITEFYIPQAQPEKQSRALYEAMPKDFQKKVSFKRFQNKERIDEIHEICRKWMKIQHKYLGEHFVIHFDKIMRVGYLVNIPLVIYTLREHHQDFSRILGRDFDPVVVVKEIENDLAIFWKIFSDNNNDYLMGLLFGFGEKNSKLFQWEKEKSISFPFRVASYDLPSFKKRLIGRSEKLENLGIPQFVVYQPTDEVVEKYLLEKQRIIQIYRKRDFAETTVAFLKGKAVHRLSKKKKSITIQKTDGRFIVKENK